MFYKGDVDFRVMLDGNLIYRKELTNAEDAINNFRKLAVNTEMPFYIYVINDNYMLKGVLSLRQLLIASSKPL